MCVCVDVCVRGCMCACLNYEYSTRDIQRDIKQACLYYVPDLY